MPLESERGRLRHLRESKFVQQSFSNSAGKLPRESRHFRECVDAHLQRMLDLCRVERVQTLQSPERMQSA